MEKSDAFLLTFTVPPLPPSFGQFCPLTKEDHEDPPCSELPEDSGTWIPLRHLHGGSAFFRFYTPRRQLVCSSLPFTPGPPRWALGNERLGGPRALTEVFGDPHKCCRQRKPFVYLGLEEQPPPHTLSFVGARRCWCVRRHGTQLCSLFQAPLLLRCWFSSSPLPSTCGSLRRSPWGLPRRSG